ncbi:FxsA family protein [Geobacter sp. AOG1]|uniref:FxsA family protein n=1 Tax=Geobacter sp. AOG1 TaxID=1566346 RepID=UPI001CC46741|nr:FxsA family protein [Geobacter sp. AOG1]GFE57885.1 membrane protein FxsA [Geobacter sp. AOG1]
MITRLFLLFAVIPVIEVYLLIKVGRVVGALPTVALLLTISMAGAWLVRHQGFHILRRIQDELAVGRLPAADLVDGVLVLVGGILLLVPGFFTDFIGLFFLVPPTRAVLKRFLGLWLQARLSRGTTVVVRRF